ncbi:M23 family metallopeptidase [Nannocystis sp. ILAH1]|uniref:M23 family metallopeptidase n=1 Tax=unclassified Nannocystis TaxID=2627009 RepID=UPI00227124AA|nr:MULTISPECIES: M23 family metallopeptidase [unclassified Nannocystis]MCY0988726.1 M23 family metallopeptidase [Nannocystis sp. ILAH1]MCY1072503.1 M23 family metallopeptidase [Nannocystis sp. RBIL2]
MPTYNPGSPYRLTSRWNPARKHPTSGKVQPHRGDDWGAPEGTPIPAAADGSVVFNGWVGGYGNTIVLEHTIRGQTVHTLYGHMNVASPLAVGTQVTTRQTVGTVGMTGGVSSGNHLHFEVMPGGTPGRPNLARGHATVDPHTFDFPDGGGGQPAETGGGPWSYPFEGNEDQKANEGTFLGVLGGQEGALARTDDGFYPIGGNSLWHGGIHFDEHSKATLDQEKGVRCIREGEIVAYRVDSEYPHVEFPNGARALYSRGFVLVRHRLEIPDGEPDKRPKLVFYSLYMHQLDFKAYKDDSKLTRPEHWSSPDRFRVGDKAKDRQEPGAGPPITGELEGICGEDGTCSPVPIPLPRPRPVS